MLIVRLQPETLRTRSSIPLIHWTVAGWQLETYADFPYKKRKPMTHHNKHHSYNFALHGHSLLQIVWTQMPYERLTLILGWRRPEILKIHFLSSKRPVFCVYVCQGGFTYIGNLFSRWHRVCFHPMYRRCNNERLVPLRCLIEPSAPDHLSSNKWNIAAKKRSTWPRNAAKQYHLRAIRFFFWIRYRICFGYH